METPQISPIADGQQHPFSIPEHEQQVQSTISEHEGQLRPASTPRTTRMSVDSIDVTQPTAHLMSLAGLQREIHAPSQVGSGHANSDTMSFLSGDDSESEADTGEFVADRQLPKGKPGRSLLLEWWGELVSLSIGIICTALAVAVLLYMNDRTMADWNLLVQPNTAVAFLATFTRAAVIYPMSECIGHLKWVHFERARALSYMNTFDVASRGPLGALKLIWGAKNRAPLASSAAIIIVILLVFQPFMQQTIEFATRSAPLSNETAVVTRTTTWLLNDSVDPDVYERFYSTWSHHMSGVFRNEAPSAALNSYCSTSRCAYPEIKSLSVCSICEEEVINVKNIDDFDRCYLSGSHNTALYMTGQPSINITDLASLSKAWEVIQGTGLRYNINDIEAECTKGLFSVFIRLENTVPMKLTVAPLQEYATWESDEWSKGPLATKGPLLFTNTTGEQWMGSIRNGNLKACRHQLPWNVSEPDYDNYTHVQSICFNSTTNIWRYLSDSEAMTPLFGGINGTLTTCSLKPCVRNYGESTRAGDRFDIEPERPPLALHLKFNLSLAQNDTLGFNRSLGNCAEGESECPYVWSIGSMNRQSEALLETLGQVEKYSLARGASFDHNFTKLWDRIAHEATYLIQSLGNPDCSNVTGIAYGPELYVRVRWVWLILPLAIMTASIIILASTIFDSRRKTYLFKNKILAAFAFEVDDWGKDGLQVDETWTRQTMKRLEDAAEKTVVKIELCTGPDERPKMKNE